ncbi:MAG: DUF1207 domain-containing protein [Nitrospirota bacterium]|jgi:hypothetical protein
MEYRIALIAVMAGFALTAVPRSHAADGQAGDELPRAFLPVGELFWPLLADPKQPQFYVSVRGYELDDETVTAAAVAYGETFGLYRWQRPRGGWQVSLAGALFAQFNLEAPSQDLVNADYTIGVPVTYRRGPWSGRLRVYHQSSHLGDEFLLRNEPERINLSFESLELLASREGQGWRGYVGGEYVLHREPAELQPGGLHGGVEYRGEARGIWHPVAAVDVKSWDEFDWSPEISAVAGVELGPREPGRRRLRLLAEAYRGHSPHGQFFAQRMRYLGLGVYLGF